MTLLVTQTCCYDSLSLFKISKTSLSAVFGTDRHRGWHGKHPIPSCNAVTSPGLRAFCSSTAAQEWCPAAVFSFSPVQTSLILLEGQLLSQVPGMKPRHPCGQKKSQAHAGVGSDVVRARRPGDGYATLGRSQSCHL